jgi:hypothetical protein
MTSIKYQTRDIDGFKIFSREAGRSVRLAC